MYFPDETLGDSSRSVESQRVDCQKGPSRSLHAVPLHRPTMGCTGPKPPTLRRRARSRGRQARVAGRGTDLSDPALRTAREVRACWDVSPLSVVPQHDGRQRRVRATAEHAPKPPIGSEHLENPIRVQITKRRLCRRVERKIGARQLLAKAQHDVGEATTGTTRVTLDDPVRERRRR
jgi:hypothetical protein